MHSTEFDNSSNYTLNWPATTVRSTQNSPEFDNISNKTFNYWPESTSTCSSQEIDVRQQQQKKINRPAGLTSRPAAVKKSSKRHNTAQQSAGRRTHESIWNRQEIDGAPVSERQYQKTTETKPTDSAEFDNHSKRTSNWPAGRRIHKSTCSSQEINRAALHSAAIVVSTRTVRRSDTSTQRDTLPTRSTRHLRAQQPGIR